MIENKPGKKSEPRYKGIGFIAPEYQPMALIGIQRAIEFGKFAEQQTNLP